MVHSLSQELDLSTYELYGFYVSSTYLDAVGRITVVLR